MDIYTHVTYEVFFNKGEEPERHHNDACFASVIGAHSSGRKIQKVVYSPAILPFYMLANLVGYGNIVTSNDAAVKWVKVLNQMFPAKDPIFTSAPGQPITYIVPEEAQKDLGIFKLHLFMMRHAFNQPQVLNYLTLLYGNKAILTPEEIYKGCLFLSCFDQFKAGWNFVYDNIHNMFGRSYQRAYKYRSYEKFLNCLRSNGNVAESWYDYTSTIDKFPTFDKKWENPNQVRAHVMEFRAELKTVFEQYIKINEENTVRT
jgi:hypothetical protein